MTTVVSLAAENQAESVPPAAVGIVTLIILLALLLFTLSFGKGRPHS